MIFPGAPLPIAAQLGGFVGPVASMTAGDSGFGDFYGFVRPGSAFAAELGTSYGSFSGTLLDGATTDAVISVLGDASTSVFFAGDVLSQLPANLTLLIDGTSESLELNRSHDAGGTAILFELSDFLGFVPSTTYSLQLIGK